MPIVRCMECGLMCVSPFPSTTQLHHRYDKSYFCSDTPCDGGYEDYLHDEPITKKTFRRRVGMILPLLSPIRQGRVLDVGCATGVFLECMKEKGWTVEGVDVSTYAVNIARQKGLRIVSGELGDIASTPANYDLITMWDFIEHVADPLETMVQCRDILKKDGVLVLATPDAGALLAKVTGSYWLGFRSVGEHLYFFNRRTIAGLLNKAGFDVVQISSIGKYFEFDRFVTRLTHYTRIFRLLRPVLEIIKFPFVFYVNSGDTMMIVARKR